MIRVFSSFPGITDAYYKRTLEALVEAFRRVALSCVADIVRKEFMYKKAEDLRQHLEVTTACLCHDYNDFSLVFKGGKKGREKTGERVKEGGERKKKKCTKGER